VSVVNGVADLDHPAQSLLDGEFGIVHGVCKRPPLHEIHREEVDSVLVPHFVNRHDPGVMQTSRCFCLTVEPFDQIFRGVSAGNDDLERHQSVEVNLSGLVDNSHPAPGKLLEDLIVSEVARFLKALGLP